MINNLNFLVSKNPPRFFAFLVCLAITVNWAYPMPATAQYSSWINTAGGFYETAQNWSAQQVPPPNHFVNFGFPGNYAVDFQNDQTSAGMLVTFESEPTFRIGGDSSMDLTYTMQGDVTINDEASLTLASGTGSGSFHLNADGYAVTIDGFEFNSHSGLIIQENSILTSSSGVIGSAPGSFGRAHLTGDNSNWNIGYDLLIGYDGPAEITVDSGASLASGFGSMTVTSSSHSTVNISGVGSDGTPSTWITSETLYIGRYGYAELNITDGAHVSNQGVETGYVEGSTASIVVSGTDASGNPSTWATGDMTNSFWDGMTFLTIEGGGLVTSDNVNLAGHGPAEVELVGSDNAGNPSQWIVAQHLNVGSTASGDIRIRNGARLSSQSVDIEGNFSLVRLESVIAGERSSWINSGDVNLGIVGGGSGNNTLLLQDQSVVEIAGTLTLAANGSLLVENSSLAADRIDHTHGAELGLDNAEVSFNRFDGDLINDDFALSPGLGSQAATLVGSYTQLVGGKLKLEIGGLNGLHDSLIVSGSADIDGQLEICLTNGFTPDSSDTFPVFAAASLIGIFDNISNGQRLDTADGLGSFIVNYGIGSPFAANQIVLSQFEPAGVLLGDVNGDGVVDLLDVAPFVEAVASGTYIAQADINGDGMVNLLDVQPFVDLLIG